MKKDEVEIGGTYLTKVGARPAEVRIEGENSKGGWNAVAVATGKPVRVKDARQLRPAGATSEQGGREDEKPGPDTVPLPQLDAEPKESRKPKHKAAGKATAKDPKQPAKPAKPSKQQGKPKPMSCLDAAAAVLKAKGEPMQCKSMVEAMAERGLWTTDAPTPAATLYSAILREMTKKGAAARFKKTERGHFALNA